MALICYNIQRKGSDIMVNIILCDDEKAQRQQLKSIIVNYMELNGLDCSFSEFASGESLLASRQRFGADLIFLDIEMGAMDGMETAKALRREDHPAIIVFVTAYDDYVFQGYDVKALNYILKPYDSHRIKDVLGEALSLLDQRGEDFYSLETGSGIYTLALKNVVYFMSDKRKIIAVTTREPVDFYGKLEDMAEKLPPYFIRVHRRYLVNLNFVTGVEKDKVIMGYHSLPVSRSHYQELLLAFAKNILE